jgi:hypothetical protein
MDGGFNSRLALFFTAEEFFEEDLLACLVALDGMPEKLQDITRDEEDYGRSE